MMQHRNITIALCCALGIAVVGAAVRRTDNRILAPDVGVTRYGGVVMVQVPFRRDDALRHVVVYLGETRVLSNEPVLPERYWNTNLYAPAPPEAQEQRVRVTVTVVETGETVSRVVTVTPGRPLALDVMAIHPDTMRYTSELSGPNNRCAPVAAAQSLIALAKAHGADAKLPAMPDTVIAELSDDMHWTPDRGVEVDDYLSGINTWTKKKGLPISSTIIENPDPYKVLDAIRQAESAQVELVLTDSRRRRIGAHAVSARVIDEGTARYLFVEDPLSPRGTDVYRFSEDVLRYYPHYTEGIVSLGRAFTQAWIGPENN